MPIEATDHVDDQPGLSTLIPAQPGPPAGLDWERLLLHRTRLLALARSCGCPADDVGDVVQEALLRAALRPPAQPERTLAFLRTTVRRLVITRYRLRQRQQRLTEHAALQPQPQPGPEERACDDAEATWLLTQTVALRPREQQALLARAAGRTLAEIALELQTTPKAVEHLTRRARRALQALAVAGCALVCLVAAATHSSKSPAHRYASHPHDGAPRHAQPHMVLYTGLPATHFPSPDLSRP